MTSINQAAEAASNLAKAYKSVLDIAEVLEHIGNLENRQKEAERNKEQAELAEKQAQVDATNAQEFLVGLNKQCDEAVGKVEEMRRSMNAEAASLKARAEHQAQEILDATNSYAQKVRAQISQELVDATAAMATVLAEKDAAVAELASFKDELASLKARF